MKIRMQKTIIAAILSLILVVASSPVLAYGTLSLSQSNVYLNVGQNTTVTVSVSAGQIVNILSISNSYVAYANISNNVVTVYGLANGTAQIQLGTYDNSSATINVSVGGSGNSYSNYGVISFSQNNVSLTAGQSLSVNIYNNNNYNYGETYYISNNSNNSVVSASISGSTINLNALSSGSSTITVNSSQNSNNSGTLAVTVTGYNYLSNLTFSQSNLNLNVGDSRIIDVYNASGTLSVSNNSNSNVASAWVNNNQVMVYAINAGSATITVFSQNNQSGIIYINVINNPNYYPYNPPAGSVLGASIYANGILLNESGTIYIVYKNLKTAFSNMPAFQGLGYELQNVIIGSDPNLTNSRFIIGSANQAHPWGSWIKKGNTVYFVHNQGLIPISSYDVFIGNGGADNLLVPANAYDFYLPMLDLMTLGDSRLR